MKKFFLSLLLLVFALSAFSQGVAINNNSAVADNSAMLDVSSSTKGILIPRMNTAQKTAIISPARGLLVYDSDTQSFWYWNGISWKEVLNNSSNITPMGPALGDLSGTYPAPNVAKIQNLDVAFGVPFDKQAMKWDALNNRWQGQNDSLFLPYNVSFGNPSKLFGITNTNNTSGATAVYGKSGAGSGILPALTIGVWGDNANGAGALGTSTNGTGVYGYSVNNYGVYGYTAGLNYAGVYGANANTGNGVVGEIFNGGIAMLGKSNGVSGKAGYFRTYNSSNPDTTFAVIQDGLGQTFSISATNSSQNLGVMSINNAGIGQAITLNNSNTANNAHMFFANQTGTGAGIYVSVANTLNTHPGIVVEHGGTGSAIEAYGFKGKAGLFQIPSASNANTALSVSTAGTGIAGSFSISNSANSADALSSTTNGTGNAADFSINNSSNSNPALVVTTNGTGRGIQSTISNSSDLAAAIYGSSAGNKAIEGIAQVNGVIGQSTGLSGGIGVFGQSSLNSSDGIGVKGISYSTVSTSGAVTGINNSNGIGIYGSSSSVSGNGIGVFGTVTGSSGIGIYGSVNANAATGIMGENTAGGTAVYGISSGASPFAVQGYADPTGGTFGIGLLGQSNNYGDGVRGFGGGAGNGVSGYSQTGSSGNGVYGEASGGTGYGVYGFSNNATRAAILGLNSSSGDGVAGTSNGAGYGVHGTAGTTGAGIYGSSNPISSTGSAALFEIGSASNTAKAVTINSNGKGEAFYISRVNGAPTQPVIRVDKTDNTDFMIFEDSYQTGHKIRFDNNGKGYFNGGTQSGGADMAEAFDVTGNRNEYEPGDVLIISIDKDRAVEKSNQPYSTLVAGVYATKPGVLMTEENIEADLSGKVPMGVLGVIPTKVCLEGGEIKRGDILVTSSQSGVAMKADLQKLKTGQAIGKALENFSGTGSGRIKVLVNVK